uniref:DUF2490 domain-containing protein n=1 Tax=uncultured Erythrobacter sp. TaxID=263913 RepID=UPI0026247D5A|nr:DUF2490 domain-containing protein [uncultured Erythrobacter sp.]
MNGIDRKEMKMRIVLMTGALVAGLSYAPAAYANQSFEFWLNPSVGTDLDENTAIELETAQRLRSERDGNVDTYFVRLWVKQAISEELTLAGSVERRKNDGGSNELRLIQQLSGKHGIVRSRLRLAQRFVDGRGGHMGLRLRPRLGLSVPLDSDGKWVAGADAELFWTLRDKRRRGNGYHRSAQHRRGEL